MLKVGLLVRLEAKPGKEAAVLKFLKSGLDIVQDAEGPRLLYLLIAARHSANPTGAAAERPSGFTGRGEMSVARLASRLAPRSSAAWSHPDHFASIRASR